MISVTAYDTLALSTSAPASTLLNEIKKAFVFEQKLVKVDLGDYAPKFDLRVIDGVSDDQKKVPSIQFPIMEEGAHGQKFVPYVDIRPGGHVSNGGYNVTLNGATEFRVRLKLAILTYLWSNGQVEQLLKLSDLPIKVFSSFIASTIRNRFVLEIDQMFKIQCIAAWYYMCLFTDKTEILGHDRLTFYTRIIRTIGNHAITSSYIESLFSDVGVINNPKELCEVIVKLVPGPQLENLNIGTLYDCLKTACFIGGPVAGRLYTYVGLEHPPTWIIIMLETMLNRGYNKTTIGSTLERYKKDFPVFIKAIHDYIGGPNAIREYNYSQFFL